MSKIDDATWRNLRNTLRRGANSSLHCAVASLNEDGSPHVSPIGSVMLTTPGRGLYFDVFASGLSRNLERDPRMTLLAVDSSRWFWLRSLIKGEFVDHPGYRLIGTAGPRRDATDAEKERMARVVRFAKGLKGHALMWRDFGKVRDLELNLVKPIRLGKMTTRLN